MSKFDIFISYSRADAKIVNSFKDRFESKGWSVWMDLDGIESGDAFKRVIVDAIEESKVVVFFASKDSNASVWTAKEIGFALSCQKSVIPVRIDKSNYNKEVAFDLVGVDYIDYTRTKDQSRAMDKLMRSLEKKIGVSDPDPGSVPDSGPVPEDTSKKKFWKRFWMILGISWGGLGALFLTIAIVSLIVERCNNPQHPDDEVIADYEDTQPQPSPLLLEDYITDGDGNSYDAVQIGEQVWMAENMRAMKDNEGNEIAFGETTSYETPY